MALPKNSLTPTEFIALMDYISLQKQGLDDARGYAASGLLYVVLLQRVTPEVDLVSDSAAHANNMEALDNSSNFMSIINSLNNHVATRGTDPLPAETLTDRLNRWLWCQKVRVTRLYADLSASAGWVIDWCNVRSDDSDNNSQMGIYVYDESGTIIAVGCTDLSPYKTWPAPGSGCPVPNGDDIGTVSP
jgi:hypothetical protein